MEIKLNVDVQKICKMHDSDYFLHVSCSAIRRFMEISNRWC